MSRKDVMTRRAMMASCFMKTKKDPGNCSLSREVFHFVEMRRLSISTVALRDRQDPGVCQSQNQVVSYTTAANVLE